jgi:hypothetical protein
MNRAEVIADHSTRELMFNIWVTPNLQIKEVGKSRILKSVRDGFYLGLSTLEDLSHDVVDMRKIEIFCKLYLMSVQQRLESWIGKYNEFMKQPQRSETEQKQLLDEYNLIVMGMDVAAVDKQLYKKADEYATRLLTLHV